MSPDPGQKSQLGISFLCYRAERKTESGCNLISAAEAAQKNKSFQRCQSVLKRDGCVWRKGGRKGGRADESTLRHTGYKHVIEK